MQVLSRIIRRNHPSSFTNFPKYLTNSRFFSKNTSDGGDFRWDDSITSSWSTGITKGQFDGESVGHKVSPPPPPSPDATTTNTTTNSDGGGVETSGPEEKLRQQKAEIERDSKWQNEVLSGWEKREDEVYQILKQVKEPGARGSYLKDSEKAEIYKKHKENPEVFTIDKLAKDYRIMRQRVHAILFLKELEEQEEKKRGEPLDDSVELLLDGFPNFFISQDREFHVASLPYKPNFKVMPEGWDGTTRDPDEVHYEISKKEDDILYEEFVQRFNFTKMKFRKQVKVHKYSRRRPSIGWDFVVTKVGARGKRGTGGGWKFVSVPDGSTRPLNEMEKVYVKRETPRRRRRILP